MIKKKFYLANNYDSKKGKATIRELNNLLTSIGIHFGAMQDKNGQYILGVQINEKQLQEATTKGRPVEHVIDWDWVMEQHKNGRTYKSIYNELDISKSLFYTRLREYRK